MFLSKMDPPPTVPAAVAKYAAIGTNNGTLVPGLAAEKGYLDPFQLFDTEERPYQSSGRFGDLNDYEKFEGPVAMSSAYVTFPNKADSIPENAQKSSDLGRLVQGRENVYGTLPRFS